MKYSKKIAKFLTDKNLTLSIAESCTGGLISSIFTDISGASKFIEKNFVTYSNSSKIELLKVNPSTIENCGVISAPVALEMAKGLIKLHGADFALSTTGILGPFADEFKGVEINVGKVFIGVANANSSKVVEYNSNKKTRALIKKDIANFAIIVLWEFINEKHH